MKAELLAMITPVLPRCHWGQAPQGAERPFVVLNRISGVRSYTHQGEDGLSEARVQADVFADRYLEASAAAGLLASALSGRSAGPIAGIYVENERDLPGGSVVGNTTLFRISVDLLVNIYR